MTRRLRLLPSADVARLGKRCYLFDRAALTENVVYVPTQRVSQRMFDVVRRVRTTWPTHEAQPVAAFQALFDNPADLSSLAQLVQAGYLEVLFHVADYYRSAGVPLPAIPFLDVVTYRFAIGDTRQHYHLPMKFTPWGYSCFRGGA